MIDQYLAVEQEAMDARHMMREAVGDYGLTVEQYITLYTISKVKDCCAADIVRRTHMQSPSLARISANLRKRELVVSVRDGKRDTLKLTKQGKYLLSRANRRVKKVQL